MKKHKHADLIKAWADGAVIERLASWTVINDETCLVSGREGWRECAPRWGFNEKYRIKPDCEYALEYIKREFSATSLEVYKHWLAGGELEVVGGGFGDLEDVNEYDSPFNSYINRLSFATITKKKRTVKQVMWVRLIEGEEMKIYWVDFDKKVKRAYCHKIPTMTREVEV